MSMSFPALVSWFASVRMRCVWQGGDLYCTPDLLKCVVAGCVPCAYKMVVQPCLPHIDQSMKFRPNTRPEECLRMRFVALSTRTLQPRAPIACSLKIRTDPYLIHTHVGAHDRMHAAAERQVQAKAICVGSNGGVRGGEDASSKRLAGIYWSGCKILTVGDGDLSFSLSLAQQLSWSRASLCQGSPTRGLLVATTHLTRAELDCAYGAESMAATIGQLEDLGALVLHAVDATNLRQTLKESIRAQSSSRRRSSRSSRPQHSALGGKQEQADEEDGDDGADEHGMRRTGMMEDGDVADEEDGDDGAHLHLRRHPLLPSRRTGKGVRKEARGLFDVVVWNFPCVTGGAQGKDSQVAEMEDNKRLMRAFFRSVPACIAEGSEVHVAHKTKAPFCYWDLRALADAEGEGGGGGGGEGEGEGVLSYTRRIIFDGALFPTYSNRKVATGRGKFPTWDAVVFVWTKGVPRPPSCSTCFHLSLAPDPHHPPHLPTTTTTTCSSSNAVLAEAAQLAAAIKRTSTHKAKQGGGGGGCMLDTLGPHQLSGLDRVLVDVCGFPGLAASGVQEEEEAAAAAEVAASEGKSNKRRKARAGGKHKTAEGVPLVRVDDALLDAVSLALRIV
jgi:hypothetical protein